MEIFRNLEQESFKHTPSHLNENKRVYKAKTFYNLYIYIVHHESYNGTLS